MKTILLAEDDLVTQSILEEILEKTGFNVVIANNGREALDELKKNNILDLILMDIVMPEVDGVEAIAQIRTLEKSEQRKKIPIIALSAGTTASERRLALESGCDDYIKKPIVEKPFLNTLAKYFDAS